MFRKDLEERLTKIFGIKRVRFDAPGESQEQDTLFVDVKESVSRAGSPQESARVTGDIVVFSQYGKLPYGFFAKKVEQAEWPLSRPLFFGVEANDEIHGNVVERRIPFTFIYQAQYDPTQGELSEIQFGDSAS